MPSAMQPAHPVERLRVGRDVLPAERGDAQRAVADERRDVDAHRAVVAIEVARRRCPSRGRCPGRPSRPPVEARRRPRAPRGCANGAKPLPSTPTTSVVTPWRTFGSWCGSARITRPPWLWRSMKPGGDDLAGGIDRARRVGRASASGSRIAQAAVRRRRRSPGGPGARAVDDRSAGDEQVGVVGHRPTIADPRARRASLRPNRARPGRDPRRLRTGRGRPCRGDGCAKRGECIGRATRPRVIGAGDRPSKPLNAASTSHAGSPGRIVSARSGPHRIERFRRQ